MSGGKWRRRVLAVLVASLPCLAPAKDPDAVKPGSARPASAARPTVDSGAPQGTREIVLDEHANGKVIGIRTARGVATTVEFPETFVENPVCGDCEVDDGAGPPTGNDALYRIQYPEHDGRFLTLFPNPSRRARERSEMDTSILVRLAHAAVTLFVEQGDRASADTRVVFTYPNHAGETEYIRAERQRIEKEADDRVKREVRARMHLALRAPHGCVAKSDRTRSDDIVLELKEICYFDRDVYFTFFVENRGRDPFDVKSVLVDKGKSDGQEDSETIDYTKPVTGIIGVQLAPGDALRGPYTLTIQERGGKERVISLRNVGL